MSEYVCKVSELVEGKCNTFSIAGQKLNLIKNEKGIFAFENKCPHMGLPLSKAKVSDETVQCSFHHAKFNFETGEVEEWASFPPIIVNAINAFRKPKSLKTFAVTVSEDEDVSVEI